MSSFVNGVPGLIPGAAGFSLKRKSNSRRRFLTTATSVAGILGAGTITYPFMASMTPSHRARARGGPVTVNLAKLEPGQQITVPWRDQPVWLLRRTPEMVHKLSEKTLTEVLRDPYSNIESQQPLYAQNLTRSITAEYFVVLGLCTHLGCVPNFHPQAADARLGSDWMGGYFCPCHGSKFDLAGRVVRNVPAPSNLVVPPHRFLDSHTVEIGVHTKLS